MELLRKMQAGDITRVIALIESHDEDDAEAAETSYSQTGGVDDQFVLEKDGEIIGVTGFMTPLGCDRIHWLSWTYVHSDHTSKGYGRKIINELIEHLKQQDGRKLFVKVSDYVSEEDGAIYAAALHLYQSIGFSIEITLKDFYDISESQIILGMRLQDSVESNIQNERCRIQFNSVYEIAETDDAYSFGWHDQGKSMFSVADVQIGIDSVGNNGGRAIFLSFPSNYIDVHNTLLAAGFSQAGVLHDYYEDGVHEHHYTFRL